MTLRSLTPALLLFASTACDAGLLPLNPRGVDTGLDQPDDPNVGDPGPGGAGTAPSITSLSVSEAGADLTVLFSATDPDDDLEGGAFELTHNGAQTSYAIPGQLTTWSGSSGTLRLAGAGGGGGACGGTTHEFSARVRDAAANRSEPRFASATVGSGAGVTTPEVGDTLYDVYDAGIHALPVTLCGDLWGVGNDGSMYTQDLDQIYIVLIDGGVTTFELTWDATADYDLYVFDWWGDLIDASSTDGTAQPEIVTFYAFPYEEFYVLIAGWSGPAGPWRLSIR